MEFFTGLEKQKSWNLYGSKRCRTTKATLSKRGRQHQTWPQIILQSHSDKTSIILARTQPCRPMEQIEGKKQTTQPLQWLQNHIREKQPLKMVLATLDIHTQKCELDPCFSSYVKIIPKWTRSKSPEPLRLQEEHWGKALQDTNGARPFRVSPRSSRSQCELKNGIARSKRDSSQPSGTSTRVKKQPAEWEKSIWQGMNHRDLQRTATELNNNPTNNPGSKQAMNWTDSWKEEKCKWAVSLWTASSARREMHTRAVLRSQLSPVRRGWHRGKERQQMLCGFRERGTFVLYCW